MKHSKKGSRHVEANHEHKKSLKRKRKDSEGAESVLDTSKPTAVFQPSGGGRHYTLSIALPGSIIANAQSHDAKTALAGTIARALAVFCVDEVVVFDDGQAGRHSSGYHHNTPSKTGRTPESGYTGDADPVYFLTHLLAYLETPPHLRRLLFPMHPDLRTAGTLPSLDMPHHLRAHEWCRYREGVAVEGTTARKEVVVDEDGPVRKKRKRRKGGEGKKAAAAAVADGTAEKVETLVDVFFASPVTVPAVSIPPLTRVTLKFASATPPDDFQHAPMMAAEAVAPSAPREEAGYYWGYSVRSCVSLSAVLTESPFAGGYDLTVGTSERGVPVSSLLHPPQHEEEGPKASPPVPVFKHMLVVFGGVAGLEPAVRADPELVKMGLEGPERLFDYWVNLCPGQGSRTIRTEEAVWLGLMGLREVVLGKGSRE